MSPRDLVHLRHMLDMAKKAISKTRRTFSRCSDRKSSTLAAAVLAVETRLVNS
jgi:hypothetical protein